MQTATYRKPSTRINPAEASNLARLGLTYDPDAPKFRAGDASPVTRRPADGTFRETRPAYTREEVAAIIKQGKDQPRALTMEEAQTAAKNRAVYYDDRGALERWHFGATYASDAALTEEMGGRYKSA